MPPLTTVDPPTHRPSAKSTDGRPIAIPPPPSRYNVRSARPVSGVNDPVPYIAAVSRRRLETYGPQIRAGEAAGGLPEPGQP